MQLLTWLDVNKKTIRVRLREINAFREYMLGEKGIKQKLIILFL